MIVLRALMEDAHGWGRPMGRDVFVKLLGEVERLPDASVRVSLRGVDRMDVSFSSETVVEIARRYKGRKGFYVTDAASPEIVENIEAAANRVSQPICIVDGTQRRYVGVTPSAGTKAALEAVLSVPQARAAEIAEAIHVTVANASMKLKALWDGGFLLRRENPAETGGVEYVYQRIA